MRRLRYRCGLLLLLGSIVTAGLKADDRIRIEAKLNDQPFPLAFDTGAGGLIIFRQAADAHHIKVIAPPENTKPAPGEVVASHTEPVKVELLGQVLPDAELLVIDSPPGLPLDAGGLVGWPAIRNNIWFLSGSARKLSSLKSVPAEADTWLKFRELKERKILCLELPATKAGTPLYLGIDTGAESGVILSPEAWARWRAEHSQRPVTLDAYFMPAAGLVVAEELWADKINIAGLILRNVPVRCMNSGETAVQPPGTIAILGLAAMLRTDAVLDGKNGLAYLKALDTPPRAYPHNRLGAVFVPTDLQTSNDLVAHVAPDSPAAKAGVHDGDVLLKIDQLDVTPWRTQPGILPLTRFFTQPAGTKLRLTLRRDGKIVSADAVLRDILSPAKAAGKSQ